MIPIVHHPDYVHPLPEGHRFPMPKFNIIRALLESDAAADRFTFIAPEPATEVELAGAHTRAWIDKVVGGGLDANEQRRIGLPWSEGLIHRTRMEVGGTILACRLALEHGIACSAAGGTHHAFAGEGSGFCIFNDLAVAARRMIHEALARRVLIVDLDVHQGDGTAQIFVDDPSVFTFSMHGGRNFPLRKRKSDLDIELPDGMDDRMYLAKLDAVLPDVVDRARPDLVLYDAGVDPHAGDRLGRLALTDEGLMQRDRRVLEHCRARGLPVACVIGGGYDHDHHRLAARHTLIHHAAASVFHDPRGCGPGGHR
ncbi:MAG: histone deacetylase [Phycisphaeraceae bacterium]|nr:histone deacetylase [Phycisphaeraceae bacterium]